jgi:putative FmdB family regulatory protein
MIYEHKCYDCGHEWEESYSIHADPPTTCPSCQKEGHVRRLITGAPAVKVKLGHKEKKAQLRQEAKEMKHKYNTDEKFRARTLLRSRLNKAVKGLCLANKFKINYKAIIDYLGPCPGDKKDYHIDHIKPLVLFDLTVPEEAQKAFAPENHQWLTKEENLKKGNQLEKRRLVAKKIINF